MNEQKKTSNKLAQFFLDLVKFRSKDLFLIQPIEQIEFDVIDDEFDEDPKKHTLDVWKITLPYQA